MNNPNDQAVSATASDPRVGQSSPDNAHGCPDDEQLADPGDPPWDYDPLAEILHRRLAAKERFVGPRKPSTLDPGIEAWIERGMAGMELMATNEAERLKVARRLF